MDTDDDQLVEMRVRAWAVAQRRRGQEMIDEAERVLAILDRRTVSSVSSTHVDDDIPK